MKRTAIYVFILGLGILSLISCNGQKKQVKQFSEKFAAFVNANQFDSIKALYPKAKFDSVSPLSLDSISVGKLQENGIIRVEFGSDKWIDVGLLENGSLMVVDSRGVAAFPKEQYDLAVGTGMLTDSIGDVEKTEIMSESLYFDWLKKNYIENAKYKVKITPGKYRSLWNGWQWGEAWKGTITITLTNMTDTPISADDYSIAYKTYESNGYTDNSERKYTVNHKRKGVALGPKESTKLTFTDWCIVNFYDFNVVPAPGKEEFLSFEFKPTGKEYAEYKEFLKNNK